MEGPRLPRCPLLPSSTTSAPAPQTQCSAVKAIADFSLLFSLFFLKTKHDKLAPDKQHGKGAASLEKLRPPGSKAHGEATVIQTVWHWYGGCRTGQRGRAEAQKQACASTAKRLSARRQGHSLGQAASLIRGPGAAGSMPALPGLKVSLCLKTKPNLK